MENKSNMNNNVVKNNQNNRNNIKKNNNSFNNRKNSNYKSNTKYNNNNYYKNKENQNKNNVNSNNKNMKTNKQKPNKQKPNKQKPNKDNNITVSNNINNSNKSQEPKNKKDFKQKEIKNNLKKNNSSNEKNLNKKNTSNQKEKIEEKNNEIKKEINNNVNKQNLKKTIDNEVNIKKEPKDNIEENNINKNDKKRNKTIFILLIIIFVVILILFIFIGVFLINYKDNKILSNVYIENIDISKLSSKTAINKLEKKYSNLTNSEIRCLNGENEYTISLEEIDFKLDIDDSVNEALRVGRDDNIFIALRDYYSLKFGNKKEINLDFTYNKNKLYEKISEIEKDFYQELTQYSYTIENNILKIKTGVPGVSIDYDKFEKEFNKLLDNKKYSNSIEIPLKIVEPDEIDVTKIHNEVHVEMKDAYYTTNPFEIHNEVTGVNFDIKALKELINGNPNKEEYTIELIITEPNIKVENLDLYKDELGICSTNYVNNPNRTMNLRLAASKVNGYVLMPGETFSYNDVVGERTIEAGYKDAAIYINGEVEDGLGGGICQISSTIYNAVVDANLEIVERSNHARVPSYLPAGKDATVYWGSKDFKFKNNRDYPVKLLVTVEGGYATAKVYGTLSQEEYDIRIETSVVSRTKNELVVNAYKVYRKDGVVVNSELLSTDSYKV